MAATIVPIELGLADGPVVTLWAPGWIEDGEEWEAFLGLDDELYVFDSAAELAAFVRTDDDHDLSDHPAWPTVAALSVDGLTPEREDRFDLAGLPRLAAGPATRAAVRDVDGALNLVFSIGAVCDLPTVTDFVEAHPEFDLLSRGEAFLRGPDGDGVWERVGRALADGWQPVLEALDDLLASPDLDPAALAEAEAEATAVDENEVEIDDELSYDNDPGVEPLDPENDDDHDDHDEDEDDDWEDDFWESVGIDPIRVITDAGSYYTLRCYLDDDAVFLGRGGRIDVFRTPRALARHLVDAHDHDLARLSTYDEIDEAATDGSLEIVVADENIYVLPGLAEDLAVGPAQVDSEQLEMAIELFEDAADYADDDSVAEALDEQTELGALAEYIRDPRPTGPAPTGPFTTAVGTWRTLEAGFLDRLTVH